MYSFDAKKTTQDIIVWINDFFEKNGKGCNAVVGISGGKDSSVVAGLCAAALGKERVIGVLMPNGNQSDIDMSIKLVEHLGIRYTIVNIAAAYQGLIGAIKDAHCGNGYGDYLTLGRADSKLCARKRLRAAADNPQPAAGKAHCG